MSILYPKVVKTLMLEEGISNMEETRKSLERLLEFEDKYCTKKMVNSQMMYWNYKIKGYNLLKESVPEIDEWVYHYEKYLEYGGDPNALKQPDTFLGRYF